MPPECEDNQHGMPASYSFDYIFDIRLPEPMLNGWNNFEVVIRWPITAPIAYQSHKSLLQDFAVSPMPPEDGGDGWWYLHVGGGSVIPGTEYLGETSVFSVSFSTLAVPDVTECQFEVCPATFQIQDSEGFPVFEDDGSYPLEYYWLPFSVKPTKTLHMHIYRVEGSATNAQIADDVQAAEDSFNLNALLCTLGFYVDFTYEITTISTDAWGRIDEDGDGLDRYDANGDGDYADPGDNNDLFNAMNEGFYDVGANTENIYYVPGIRGGAMGTTYWPNQQVAIDNSTDSDNLTLAHEKVHEMDLRKDGDFDVLDGADMNDEEDGIQRDPAAEGQGAYGSGNLLNYSDTGPLLSGTQAGELDP